MLKYSTDAASSLHHWLYLSDNVALNWHMCIPKQSCMFLTDKSTLLNLAVRTFLQLKLHYSLWRLGFVCKIKPCRPVFFFFFLLLFIYHFNPNMSKMWQRLKLTISVNSKLTCCKIVSCCTTSLEKLFFVVHPSCAICVDLLQKEMCLCAFWFCTLYLRSLIFRITVQDSIRAYIEIGFPLLWQILIGLLSSPWLIAFTHISSQQMGLVFSYR